MKKFKRMCPVCNSTDVKADTTNPVGVTTGLLETFKCNRCGNTGNFFPEVDAKKQPNLIPLDKIKNRNLVDKTFINYYSSLTGKLWKFLGIGMLILSFIFIFSRNNHNLIYYGLASIVFYLGLIFLLPLAVSMLIISFKREFVQKHTLVRLILGLIIVSSFTVSPFVAYKLSTIDKLNDVDRSQFDPMNNAGYTSIDNLKVGVRSKISGLMKTELPLDIGGNEIPGCSRYYYLQDDTGIIKLFRSSGADLDNETYDKYLDKNVEIIGRYREGQTKCTQLCRCFTGFVIEDINII